MNINPIALTIRAKKLGVLIQDARLSVSKSSQECAQAIRVSAEQFEEYEFGEKSPSLPELERLAFFTNVPLSHFWSDRAISSGDGQKDLPDLQRGMMLRQRMIGALLQKARQEAGLSLDDLAERAWSSTTLLESYELGETPIPLPDLEVLCGLLNRSIDDFRDQRGPLGNRLNQDRAVQAFLDLPPELRAFVTKPVNQPYLELALRLSEMSVEKLRAVAEGLLEITL